MAMQDWVSTLMQQMCDSGNWASYGSPNTVATKGEIDTDGGIAYLSLVYDEGSSELHFVWDPKHTVSDETRPICERAVKFINDHINESDDLLGEFIFTEECEVLFTASLPSTFNRLYPAALDDINQFAMGLCGICGNMYPAILEIESGENMYQVLMLAFARGDELGQA